MYIIFELVSFTTVFECLFPHSICITEVHRSASQQHMYNMREINRDIP